MENTPTKDNTANADMISLDFSADIQKPIFSNDNRKGIVKYGDNNLYPDFLLDLFVNKSNKHNSIIKRKVAMTTGQGFETIISPELQKFADNFRGSHPLEDLAQLLNTDYEVFNAFALLVRWNEDKSKVAAIDYVPVHKVRKGLDQDTWYVSDNWQHSKKEESNTRMYKAVSGAPVPKDATDEERRLSLVQLFYFGSLTIGTDCYPHVNYQSAINYIMADYEISRYTLNNIHNNFVGGYHINFRGPVPDGNERKKIKKKFTTEYTGAGSNRILMTWNEEEGNATTATPLPTAGNEDAFMNVEQQVRTNIFVAHGVTNPLLFGIQVPGSLGGKEELAESLEIYQATDINPKQLTIEKVFSRLSRLNGIPEEIKLAKYKLRGQEEIEEVEPNIPE